MILPRIFGIIVEASILQ